MDDPSAWRGGSYSPATRMDGAYYYFARHSGMPENLLALFYALADGKPHSQKEICEDWLIPKTTINTVVKEQVAAGHLTLRAGEGREKIICLTEAGRAYAEKAISALCAAERAAAERTMAKHGVGFVEAIEDFADALWQEYEACLQETKG